MLPGIILIVQDVASSKSNMDKPARSSSSGVMNNFCNSAHKYGNGFLNWKTGVFPAKQQKDIFSLGENVWCDKPRILKYMYSCGDHGSKDSIQMT